MNGQTHADGADIAFKIARLVEERGWNQEDFARLAQLNRQTVRQILQPRGTRRLRNVTVSRCAGALGFSVHEMRSQPLERLLPRVHGEACDNGDGGRRRLFEMATQPELATWMECNPERAKQLTADEVDELTSLQGTGGPLTPSGVEQFVTAIERRRRIVEQVHAIAGTEYVEMLEQFVKLVYEKVQPYRDRA